MKQTSAKCKNVTYGKVFKRFNGSQKMIVF